MHCLQAKLAHLAEDYPLTSKQAWRDAVESLGPLELFAIESEPATYDIGRDAFSGRARVLAEILSSRKPELNESVTIGASVKGTISESTPEDAEITEFHLDALPLQAR